MKHRHPGRYRTKNGFRRRPLHKVSKARPLKMPIGWVPSRRYRHWAEIPVRSPQPPREVIITDSIPLGIMTINKPRRLPTRIVRDFGGRITGVR